MEELAANYLPAPSFERFRVSQGGFCPPEIDCSGFIELDGEGNLRVDRLQEFPIVVHEAAISDVDLQAAVGILTDPALIELLDLEEPPCDMPSGVHEYMSVTSDGVEHGNSTTFCDIPAIEAARELMDNLASSYL